MSELYLIGMKRIHFREKLVSANHFNKIHVRRKPSQQTEETFFHYLNDC